MFSTSPSKNSGGGKGRVAEGSATNVRAVVSRYSLRACILAEGGCQRALRLIRAVAASGEAGPVGGVRFIGEGKKGGGKLGSVLPRPLAFEAHALRWPASVKAQPALSGVPVDAAGVRARLGHAITTLDRSGSAAT